MTQYQVKYEKLRKIKNLDLLSETQQKNILQIVEVIEKKRFYRGKGGQMMRSAVCRFIQCVSLAEMKLSNKAKRRFVDTLLDCLRHPIVEISECARLAFKQFFTSYCHKVTKGIERTMVKLFKASTDPNVALTRGYT